MIQVVPFMAEHLWLMEVRSEICEAEKLWMNEVKPEYLYEKFPSLTIMDGARIIACFGGIYLWQLRTISDIYKYKKELLKQIQNLTDFCFILWNLNRVQTVIQKDWIVARRFAEGLGYVQEGELPYYMGNTTYLMYAKLKEN
jgi:hypothetical protein